MEGGLKQKRANIYIDLTNLNKTTQINIIFVQNNDAFDCMRSDAISIYITC